MSQADRGTRHAQTSAPSSTSSQAPSLIDPRRSNGLTSLPSRGHSAICSPCEDYCYHISTHPSIPLSKEGRRTTNNSPTTKLNNHRLRLYIPSHLLRIPLQHLNLGIRQIILLQIRNLPTPQNQLATTTIKHHTTYRPGSTTGTGDKGPPQHNTTHLLKRLQPFLIIQQQCRHFLRPPRRRQLRHYVAPEIERGS